MNTCKNYHLLTRTGQEIGKMLKLQEKSVLSHSFYEMCIYHVSTCTSLTTGQLGQLLLAVDTYKVGVVFFSSKAFANSSSKYKVLPLACDHFFPHGLQPNFITIVMKLQWSVWSVTAETCDHLMLIFQQLLNWPLSITLAHFTFPDMFKKFDYIRFHWSISVFRFCGMLESWMWSTRQGR